MSDSDELIFKNEEEEENEKVPKSTKAKKTKKKSEKKVNLMDEIKKEKKTLPSLTKLQSIAVENGIDSKGFNATDLYEKLKTLGLLEPVITDKKTKQDKISYLDKISKSELKVKKKTKRNI
jgi:hypothetical protein